LNSGSDDTTTGRPAKLVLNIGPYLKLPPKKKKKKQTKAINKNEKNKLLMVTPRCPIYVVGINITKKYICMWVCNIMAHINLK
jgi:hypothetical protein